MIRALLRWLLGSPRVSGIQPMAKGSLSARLLQVHFGG